MRKVKKMIFLGKGDNKDQEDLYTRFRKVWVILGGLQQLQHSKDEEEKGWLEIEDIVRDIAMGLLGRNIYILPEHMDGIELDLESKPPAGELTDIQEPTTAMRIAHFEREFEGNYSNYRDDARGIGNGLLAVAWAINGLSEKIGYFDKDKPLSDKEYEKMLAGKTLLKK